MTAANNDIKGSLEGQIQSNNKGVDAKTNQVGSQFCEARVVSGFQTPLASRVLLTAGAFKRRGPLGRQNGRLYSDFLKSGVFYSVVTNAPFIGRVEKGSS